MKAEISCQKESHQLVELLLVNPKELDADALAKVKDLRAACIKQLKQTISKGPKKKSALVKNLSEKRLVYTDEFGTIETQLSDDELNLEEISHDRMSMRACMDTVNSVIK